MDLLLRTHTNFYHTGANQNRKDLVIKGHAVETESLAYARLTRVMERELKVFQRMTSLESAYSCAARRLFDMAY
jgi:hypothetical protein